LVPVILNGERVVISTETKNLQEQLLKKDIPIIQDILKKHCDIDIKCGIAKGKGNYVCHRRMNKYGSKMDEGIIGEDYLKQFKKLKKWIKKTENGDFDTLDWEIPIALKEKVKCSTDDCTGRKCPFIQCSHSKIGSICDLDGKICQKKGCSDVDIQCFKEKQKRYLSKCNIIISNHALYMINVFAERDILPAHNIVVLDEAQHVYDRAVESLSTEISNFKIKDLVSDVKSVKDDKSSLFGNGGNSVIELAEKASASSDAFFESFLKYIKDDTTSIEFTLPEDYDVKWRDIFIEDLKLLNHELNDLLMEVSGDDSTEVESYAKRCEAFIEELYKVTTPNEESVNWVRYRNRSKRYYISLNVAPIVVNTFLNEFLFETKSSVILTSATMAVGHDFGFFRSQLGVPPTALEGIIGSPFDYKMNCNLCLSNYDIEAKDFEDNVSNDIIKALKKSKGRAFCLFTSYKAMNKAYDKIKDMIDYPILKQGDMPRPALLKSFVEMEHAVLFGTSSFWEGVSIEGEQLSAVIIDKIPFPVPSDPIMSAKINKAKRDFGKGWFNEYYLPIAVLKLKQGFGRLIRTKTDKGFVFILDGRLRTKSYGKSIVMALPPAKIVYSIDDVDVLG
jgi:ATP-dependent DNA helicase DinG